MTTFCTAHVIKVKLCLYSPMSFHYWEAVVDVDLDNGYFLPEGSPIIVRVYLARWNPEYFPDPQRFELDRVFPENSVCRRPYAYIVFGLGRMLSVGHSYTMMDSKTILSTVLRRYSA